MTMPSSVDVAHGLALHLQIYEFAMDRFKSAGSAQQFLSFHAATYNTFNVQRHLCMANS